MDTRASSPASLGCTAAEGGALALLLAGRLARSLGPAGQWVFPTGFWPAVFSALLGVWQSLPYLYADFHRLRGTHPGPPDGLGRSKHYRTFLVLLGTIPLVLVRWPVRELQLAFGLTGAMLLPLLALTLLIMNNRVAWVGNRLRATVALNAVLVAALAFFAYVGLREIRQLLGL